MEIKKARGVKKGEKRTWEAGRKATGRKRDKSVTFKMTGEEKEFLLKKLKETKQKTNTDALLKIIKKQGVRKMRKQFNYYNAKSFKSTEDERICNEMWDKEIELTIDENGRVYDESDRYIADAEYQESSEY